MEEKDNEEDGDKGLKMNLLGGGPHNIEETFRCLSLQPFSFSQSF